MAVLEDAMRIASDAKRGLNDVWSSFRLEMGSIWWAILALVVSLIINIWLIVGTSGRLLGLVNGGEGSIWHVL